MPGGTAPEPRDAEPPVSVVIPTYDRRARLARVLAALAEQRTDTDFEVIVVSDGCTDGTDDDLRDGSFPIPVVALRQENAGPAAARNLGAAHARGDLLVFVDDDLVPTPGFVEGHVAAHRTHRCDRTVVIGPMVDPPDHPMSPWIAWEQSMLAKQYAAMACGEWAPTARQFFSGNASLRRDFFASSGGFDPAYRRLEDVELAYRLDDLGARWVFEPGVRGHHYAERSFAAWLRTAEEYGRNEIRIARTHDRPWIAETIRAERSRRNPALRALLDVTADRRRLSSALQRSAHRWARSRAAPLTPRLTRHLLSAAYNDAYYRGVRDELSRDEVVTAPPLAETPI